MALNCTITKASEKTSPVSGSVPEAMAESMAVAVPALIWAPSPGRKRASSRGTVSPATTAPKA